MASDPLTKAVGVDGSSMSDGGGEVAVVSEGFPFVHGGDYGCAGVGDLALY